MPYHGEFYMLEHNAEMAENVIGIPRERIMVADDGDIVELMPEKTIRKPGRIHVGINCMMMPTSRYMRR